MKLSIYDETTRTKLLIQELGMFCVKYGISKADLQMFVTEKRERENKEDKKKK